MAYVLTHTHRDGRVERAVRTIDGTTPAKRLSNMAEGLAASRRELRNSKGWSKDKKMRLVARIPREVVDHCLKNQGPAATADTKYLLRHAAKLGIDCRVSKGRF
jgi:hypothetical protein